MRWLNKKWDDILTNGMVVLALAAGIYAGLEKESILTGVGVAVLAFIIEIAAWVVIVVIHWFNDNTKPVRCEKHRGKEAV